MPIGTASHRWTYAKLSVVSAVWGGTFVAGRALSGELPPLVLASLRFLLAGIVLLAVLRLSRRRIVAITRVQATKVIVLGFFGIFLYNICFFYGLDLIDASRASLIVAINPAVIALVGFFCFKEKLPAVRMVGIVLCLAGAILVITSRAPGALTVGSAHWAGDILILGCVLSWVTYSVFGRGLISEIGSLETVTYSVVAGAVMLAVAAAASGQLGELRWEALSWKNTLALFYLGVFGSALAYVLYYEGIEKIGSTRAGTFIALNPLTSVLDGAALLGERLTLNTLIAGGIVIAGLVVSNGNFDFVRRFFAKRENSRWL